MDIKAFPEIGGEDGIWVEYTSGDYTLVPIWRPPKSLIRRIIERVLPRPVEVPPVVTLPPAPEIPVVKPKPVEIPPAPPEPEPVAAAPEAPLPPYVPTWGDIYELVRQRLAIDWSTFKNWMRSKWSTIWRK